MKSIPTTAVAYIEGSLRYCILEPRVEEHILTSESAGIVEPEVPHEVEPLGNVRSFVEFFRTSPEHAD